MTDDAATIPNLAPGHPLEPLVNEMDQAAKACALFRDSLLLEVEWGAPRDAVDLQALVNRGAKVVRVHLDRLEAMVGATGAIKVGP